MNKTELVAAVAEKAEISKKDSEKALKAFDFRGTGHPFWVWPPHGRPMGQPRPVLPVVHSPWLPDSLK